ncbi:MAG TPA: serpin family protein [Phycisphaerae bacterium]|nr:serpin family protein [Phycisphaerae bacterium]
MKRAMITMICVLATALSVATAQGRRPAAVPPEATQVAEAGNAFAADLYAKLAADEKGNLFFSPSSIHTALAMTYAGAGGRTAEQMAATLHYKLPAAKLAPAFGELLKVLNTPRLDWQKKPAYQLCVSNALWPQKSYPFKADYTKLVKDSYGAEIQALDYATQADQARKTINDAVAKQTKDKIKNLIPPGLLSAATRLVLTNAIYFKSNWAEKFHKAATKDKPFTLAPGKTVEVPMMSQKHRFGYLETEDLQALSMPYWMHDLSMFVILPKKADGLAAVEKKLTANDLSKILAGVKPEEVQVSLPRFKFTSQFRLADTLAKMGMPDAFAAETADFSGMTTMEKLFISEVIHKAFVAVDEEGTEAAAATAVIMPGMAAPAPREPKIFNADHPFLFLIRHNRTGAILFMGRVANPKGGE